MSADKNKEKKGFKGLSDLASDVSKGDQSQTQEDFEFEQKKPKSSSAKTPSTTKHKTSSSPPKPPPPSPPSPPKSSPPSTPPGKGSTWKWIVGIIVFFFIVSIFAYEEDYESQPTNSRPTTQDSGAQQSTSDFPSTSSKSQTSDLEFSKPPAGENNILSLAQLRWCFREDIFLENIRDVVDTNHGIEGFNKLVDNYNSRCASFRYREGTLQRARREVEENRKQFVSAAIQKALDLGWISSETDSASTTSSSPDSQHIKEAQQLLSELGYDPGPIDGIWGPRTESALRKFQGDFGLKEDGVIDQDILSKLRLMKEKMIKVEPRTMGSSSSLENKRTSGIPANASLNYFGNNWECNRGYRRAGNECVKVNVPANASLNYLGNNWECNRGYRKAGNECVPL